MCTNCKVQQPTVCGAYSKMKIRNDICCIHFQYDGVVQLELMDEWPES